MRLLLLHDAHRPLPLIALGLLLALLAVPGNASRGDRLPEFRECVQACIEQNCQTEPAPLPLHLKLLLWTCPSECDYTCQQSITRSRVAHHQRIEQFHGKWPFRRLYGIQEPFSVLFSILNGYAHYNGLKSLHSIPPSYPLKKHYTLFAYFGLTCWFWSSVFHTRDFVFTERMDYFAAGANVLYGLYYAPIRVFRLYKPGHKATLSLWTTVCVSAYLAHAYYLQFVKWDYTYNMAANVVVGAVTNLMWSYFSVCRYRRLKRPWAAWPGLIVMWLVMAMGLELLDFPPIAGALDAHSLWHAGTVLPTIWWYWFLLLDSRHDVEAGDEGVMLKEFAKE